VKYDKATFQGHRHFISYVSVDKNYRKQGIAKELVNYWKENVWMGELGKCGVSGFTEDGFNYLRPVLQAQDIDFFMEDLITF